VVLLDHGRVIARGPHEELLVTEPRYRDVLAAMEADQDNDDDATKEIHDGGVSPIATGGGGD
jgi:ATP-binding cassette subfamily B protein